MVPWEPPGVNFATTAGLASRPAWRGGWVQVGSRRTAPRVSGSPPDLATIPPMRALSIRLAFAAAAFAASPVAAQELVDDPVIGRVEFIFRGGSLVNNTGLDNGVNCIEDSGSATVLESDLPSRPTLVRAVLTVAGSLLDDDGPDYLPDTEIMSSGGADASNANEVQQVEQAAFAAADRQVSFLPPGATTPVELTATSSSIQVYNRPAVTESPGNVGFFTTRFDVTDLLRDLPSLAGTYVVSDLLADVCYGQEARCSDGVICDDVSRIHPNGLASFSLLLVVESPSLPLRTVAAFEGLRLLNDESYTLLLETRPFSDPAAGRLAFYALEGDLGISAFEGTLPPCSSREYIEVDGDADPLGDGLCLFDDDNPVGNLFNATINVAPADPLVTPTCTAPDPIECCTGDALCGTVGVDIDQFDISDAIEPGRDELRVTVGTGTDLVVLSSVVLEADLFEPVLNVDSQIRVREANANGQVQLGSPITYVIAISNTGNVDATDVTVRMSVPPRVSDFELLSVPDGATNTSAPRSGLNGTGLINVTGLTVPAGSIAPILFRVTTECDALNLTLRPTASIGTTTQPAFEVAADPVTVVGPGVGVCDGFDPEGPFLTDDTVPLPPRILRGGGGCTATVTLPWVVVLLGLVLLRRRQR